MACHAKIIIPLYIYPLTEETWRPLYEAFRISSHLHIDFVVIVNPNSGPGGAPLPGHDYCREIPKLNKQPNVCTVGYVRIDYCRKPLHEVYAEIDTYAGWASDSENANLGMKGIFVDETPNHYSPERAEYLDALRKHIKSSEGILGTNLVIHNPGTPPDAGLAAPVPNGPDVIVTCEEPFHRYHGNEVRQRLKEYHHDRMRSSYMISGVPRDQIGRLVRELRHRGDYLFVTDLVKDFYESFGESLHDFVDAMETA